MWAYTHVHGHRQGFPAACSTHHLTGMARTHTLSSLSLEKTGNLLVIFQLHYSPFGRAVDGELCNCPGPATADGTGLWAGHGVAASILCPS